MNYELKIVKDLIFELNLSRDKHLKENQPDYLIKGCLPEVTLNRKGCKI